MTDFPRSGILVVEKGAGVTSFSVVAHLRRRLRVSKVGHGGTLDPEATGVLPILVGEATKLTPYLMDREKEYRATVRLYEGTGRFLGVGRFSDGGVLKPERILHGDRPRRPRLPA